MRMKPKSTVHNPRALLYKRFTDIETSVSIDTVYKTTIDNKLWYFSIESGGFIEYSGSNYTKIINVLSTETNATILKYGDTLYAYRENIRTNNYAWVKVTSYISAPEVVITINAEASSFGGQDEYYGTLSIQDYLVKNPFAQSITFTADHNVSRVNVSVRNELGFTALYRLSQEYTDEIEAGTSVSLPLFHTSTNPHETERNIVTVEIFSYDPLIDEIKTEVSIPVTELNILGGRFNDIGRYQTNKYYYAGSFDYMIRGSVGSQDTQYIKGNIMHLRSFEIKHFDDNINIDHDDLVVIEGRLYSVSDLTYDIKRSPKPYTVYFATLNNIL